MKITSGELEMIYFQLHTIRNNMNNHIEVIENILKHIDKPYDLMSAEEKLNNHKK